jgi:replicative DNA helicase
MKDLEQLQLEQTLATYEGEDKVVAGNILLAQLKERPRPKLSFETKIPKLDSIIKGGLKGGQLLTISGWPGHGKSTLAKSIALGAMSQGYMSTWFSYELDMEDFLTDFPDDTVHNIFMPSLLSGRSPEWIEQRAWEGKLKYSSNIIIVDHLHFLIDLHKSRNISFDVGAIVRDLKLLAVKHNLVVILICHTTKATGDDVELRQGDIRDSGLIEGESDIVLYCWRDLEVDNRTIMKITKNRPTGVINKKIRLIHVGGRLYEEQGDPEENTGTDTRDRSRMGKGQKKGVFVQPDNRYGS